MDDFSKNIANITPTALHDLVLDLVAKQAPGVRDSVNVNIVVREVTTACDLGSGQERKERYDRVVEAIKQALVQIPGMRFVPSLG